MEFKLVEHITILELLTIQLNRENSQRFRFDFVMATKSIDTDFKIKISNRAFKTAIEIKVEAESGKGKTESNQDTEK